MFVLYTLIVYFSVDQNITILSYLFIFPKSGIRSPDILPPTQELFIQFSNFNTPKQSKIPKKTCYLYCCCGWDVTKKNFLHIILCWHARDERKLVPNCLLFFVWRPWSGNLSKMHYILPHMANKTMPLWPFSFPRAHKKK